MSPKDATRVAPTAPKNAKCPPVSHVPAGIFINEPSIDAKPLRLALDLTHAFILDGCRRRLQRASTTCGRMSPPMSTKHDVVAYGKLAACQPRAHSRYPASHAWPRWRPAPCWRRSKHHAAPPCGPAPRHRSRHRASDLGVARTTPLCVRYIPHAGADESALASRSQASIEGIVLPFSSIISPLPSSVANLERGFLATLEQLIPRPA